MSDVIDDYFFRYQAYGGAKYFKYCRARKKHNLEILKRHKREHKYIWRFYLYGEPFLKCVRDAIIYKITPVIDLRDLEDGNSESIMKWICIDWEDVDIEDDD